MNTDNKPVESHIAAGRVYAACFHEHLGKEYAWGVASAFRDSGCNLATAAIRMIASINSEDGCVDGTHRLALAVSEWFDTVANERHIT